MRLFPLILAVIYSIDCLLAVWTAERAAIGSGHHLINTLNASSIQSHCITTDGWRDGLIMNTQRDGGGWRSTLFNCLLLVSLLWSWFIYSFFNWFIFMLILLMKFKFQRLNFSLLFPVEEEVLLLSVALNLSNCWKITTPNLPMFFGGMAFC